MLFVLCTAYNLFSEDKDTQIKVGVITGLNDLNHKAKIPLIPESSNCGFFTDGNGNGFLFGLIGKYDLFKSIVYADARISYESRPSVFKNLSDGFNIYFAEDYNYTSLVIEHKHKGALSYLNLDIGLNYNFYKFFNNKTTAYFRLFLDAGNPIFNSDYISTQEIISPKSALFPDGTKRREIDKGEFLTVGTSLGAGIGFGLAIELPQGLNLFPEISFRYGLNPVSDYYQWHTNLFRASVSATWDIIIKQKAISNQPILPIYDEQAPSQTIVEQPVKTDIPSIIRKFEISDLQIIKTITTQSTPLLPYIFFDEGQSDLDNKYIQAFDISKFDEESLPYSTLDIYYRTLDIIALRMLRNPQTSITITGTTDGYELSSEQDRLELARNRAQTISNYFTNKWNIPKDRLTISATVKPKVPTSDVYEEGKFENRRVEITSSNTDILSPVVHSKFFEYATKQTNLFASVSIDDSDITDWAITITDKQGNEIHKQTGKGATKPILSIPVNKILLDDAVKAAKSNNNLIATLYVKNSNNLIEQKQVPINIREEINKYELGRLSLIVFDFDKYQITSSNKDIISEFVVKAIKPQSIVSITGSTDKLGTPEYNLKLSENRAITVRDYLKSLLDYVSIQSTKGVGDKNLIYDNSTPEGRFYSRTVTIEIQTPINE